MPTASFRIDPLDTARAAVAKDMDAISERIRSLKTRRNALLPVSSLPTEIISSIFFLLSVVDPVCVASKLGWIKVTHVCQAWRNVALDSPLLWRRIDGLIGRQWAYEMLGRAKDLPLALTIPYDFMRFVADPELLARTFELTLDAFLFSFSLGEILESPAPILESFWLSQTEGRLHSGELLLSTTLFDDNAPKLREIHLSNFVLPWTCLKSNSLTVLDVDTTSGKEEHLFPLSDLLVALKNCPQLEYLKLHNCLPYRDVPPRDGPAIVHLSRLQHLMLAGETACVAGLFQALCIPHTSTLSLSCKGSEFGSEYDPGNDPDVILPLVFKHVNGPGSAPFQSVSLELPIGCESEAYLEIVARRSSLPESGFDSASKFYNVHHSSDAELKLLFSRFPYYPLVPAFPKLMSNLPLADVHCLHVDAHNPRDWSSDSSWAEAFRCMSKVTTLGLVGAHGADVLELLADTDDSSWVSKDDEAAISNAQEYNSGDSTPTHPGVNRGPLFPQLRQILASGVRFARMDGMPLTIPAHYFRYTLQERMRRGTPVEKICFEKCAFVGRDDANKIKAVVPEFFWDNGIKPYYWSDDSTSDGPDEGEDSEDSDFFQD